MIEEYDWEIVIFETKYSWSARWIWRFFRETMVIMRKRTTMTDAIDMARGFEMAILANPNERKKTRTTVDLYKVDGGTRTRTALI